jgi:hypothetical protein
MSDRESLRAAYQQICESYHAIDDFRMKLLGLLPVVSVAGLFALDTTGLVRASAGSIPAELPKNEIVAYLATFAALFTLGLFLFEIRGILMCNDLILHGRRLERQMDVAGQFTVCDEKRCVDQYRSRWQRFLATHINAKLAASAIYSLVCSSWLFVALRHGFGQKFGTCVLCAAGTGLLLAAAAYYATWQLVHVSTPPEAPAAKTGTPIAERA